MEPRPPPDEQACHFAGNTGILLATFLSVWRISLCEMRSSEELVFVEGEIVNPEIDIAGAIETGLQFEAFY